VHCIALLACSEASGVDTAACAGLVYANVIFPA